MKLIKPKFWETKNFISYTLYPLSIVTYLFNFKLIVLVFFFFNLNNL